MSITINRKFAVVAATIALFAFAAFGSFAYGESTRMSGTDVDTLVQKKVKHAESVAANQAAVVATETVEATQAAAKAAKQHEKKAVKKARDSAYNVGSATGYANGNADGTASGTAAGYSAGTEDGHVNGMNDATDGVTCSDDADVLWLPYCD
jgi:hypothetical protein